MTSRSAREFRFTGFHAGLLVGAFFAVVVTVNIIMAIAASGSWSGLVVANSYVASQHFNERLAEGRAQDALGWTSHFVIEAGEAAWRLADARGEAVIASSASATFMHPVDEGGDMTVALARRADGAYAAPVRLAPGQWAVRLRAEAGLAKPFEESLRILVDQGGEAQ